MTAESIRAGVERNRLPPGVTASEAPTQTVASAPGLACFRSNPGEPRGAVREATGLLLALQIKSGRSYFQSPLPGGWSYRGKKAHLRYWRRHGLPVVLLLVDLEGPGKPDGPEIYWATLPPRGGVDTPDRATFTVPISREQVEDYYERHEDVPPIGVFQDPESPGGHYVVEGARRSGVRPYAHNGEIASYRFRLSLNRLGRAYMDFFARSCARRAYPPFYIARAFGK
jgi:hypothetical protein